MSLGYEQQRALLQSQELLLDLLDRRRTPRVPKEVRERAYRCLRHFPFLDGETGEPMFSHDEFTEWKYIHPVFKPADTSNVPKD